MTHPELESWPTHAGRFRRSEVSAPVGHGEAAWEEAATRLLHWGVKTRSGFDVESSAPVQPGQQAQVIARLFGLRIVEPVEVVSVVQEANRVGFSYRALPGHPVRGEEAFIVDRRDDEVHLTVRSLTRASDRQPWRTLYPVLLLIQRIVRRRYMRALRQ